MTDLKLESTASMATLDFASSYCNRSLMQLQWSVAENKQRRMDLEAKLKDTTQSYEMAYKRAAEAEALSERELQARKRSDAALEAGTRSLIGFTAKLREISGDEGQAKNKAYVTMESCLDACEIALEPLAKMRDEHVRAKLLKESMEGSEDKSKVLKLACLSLGRQLPTEYSIPEDAESCTWDEAIYFCHKASAKLQDLDERPESTVTSTSMPSASTPHSLLVPCQTGVHSSNAASLPSWENANKCGVCSSSLGKRRLRPRHHCRLCGKSVCNACSPNLVQVSGYQKPQRACSGCMGDIKQTGSLQQRLAQLAKQLDALGGSQPISSKQSLTMTDSVELCEQAVLALIVARK